jgi:hypothetical protein
MRGKRYDVVFGSSTPGQIAWIGRKYAGTIRDAIFGQLSFEPDVQTTNRKPLQQPSFSGATWELRFGSRNRFRAYYRIDVQSRSVWVLAVGVKERNRILIAGEVVTP